MNSIDQDIMEAFDIIHNAICDFNDKQEMSIEARLRLVQLGQTVTTQFDRLRLKSNEWVNNELPF